MMPRWLQNVKLAVDEFMVWIDTHPRTGWYIAAMVTLNVVLNILDLLH